MSQGVKLKEKICEVEEFRSDLIYLEHNGGWVGLAFYIREGRIATYVKAKNKEELIRYLENALNYLKGGMQYGR